MRNVCVGEEIGCKREEGERVYVVGITLRGKGKEGAGEWSRGRSDRLRLACLREGMIHQPMAAALEEGSRTPEQAPKRHSRFWIPSLHANVGC